MSDNQKFSLWHPIHIGWKLRTLYFLIRTLLINLVLLPCCLCFTKIFRSLKAFWPTKTLLKKPDLRFMCLNLRNDFSLLIAKIPFFVSSKLLCCNHISWAMIFPTNSPAVRLKFKENVSRYEMFAAFAVNLAPHLCTWTSLKPMVLKTIAEGEQNGIQMYYTFTGSSVDSGMEEILWTYPSPGSNFTGTINKLGSFHTIQCFQLYFRAFLTSSWALQILEEWVLLQVCLERYQLCQS